MSRRRAHYVLSTHWDREWHEPFQHFRYRLVQLFDRVVDDLDAGVLVGPFQTDGQAVVMEDYLEVRPERAEQVTRQARAGKLVIGPWYVLPDEFLVSGESLVRNIRRGREVARSFGVEPSGAGFLCDIFGHCSQVPQLYRLFGLPFGILWRGLNTIERRNLIWRGADGTELPVMRFGHHGYCGYDYDVRHATNPNHAFDADQARAGLRAWLDKEAAATDVDAILMFDGGDHLEYDSDQYAVLREAMDDAGYPFEIVHTSLDAYGAELVAQAERIGTTVEGELREPARHHPGIDDQWLIPGVLSSRVWIKQDNVACQDLLCLWTEPLCAFAADALGADYPAGFLNVAWRWLLRNHPHDSICGCSVDQVHQDMVWRFSQCRQIGERLLTEASTAIAASVEGEVTAETLRVTLFNPLPRPFAGHTEVTLPIPTDWPLFNEFFGFEPKPGFRIFDSAGQEVPYQRLDQAMGRTKKRLRRTAFPQAYPTHDVTVALPIAVPPLGYTTLTVRRAEPGEPTRHPELPGLATSERGAENELLAFSIESNGTITLTDKRTGAVYHRLLTFEDCADIGDGWYHGVAVNNQAWLSTGSAADVALVDHGPYLTSFRIRTHLRVPREFCFAAMRRSDELVDLVCDSLVKLRPGQEYLEVTTTVLNTAEDHRLRVLCPSGAESDTMWADTPYDVVERPIALRADNHLYRELEVETKPQQSFTAVADGRRGLAVVSVGLMESTVRDLPERPVALTLFRGTRRTVMTNGEPDGQLLGRTLTFRYRLVPIAEVDPAALCWSGQELAAGLRAVPIRPEDQAVFGTDRALPPSGSYCSVDGPVVVTTVEKVAGATEIRLFNPAAQPVTASIALKATSLLPVDLESNPLGESVPVVDGAAAVTLGPKQIVTLRAS